MPKNRKPRGIPLPDKLLVRVGPMTFFKNSPLAGMRLGKSTRPSDMGFGIRGRPTHTKPVKHFVNEHIDTTGARDPSRIRQAATKARYHE